MTSTTAHLIHDDGGTTVRLYGHYGTFREEFRVNAESGINPRDLLPARCEITVERFN